MTALNALYDEVIPLLPGCPLALVDYHLKRASVEFHQGSGALFMTTDLLDYVWPGPVITLPIPAEHMLHGVTAAWWQGKPLELRGPDELADLAGEDWKSQVGEPEYLTQLDDDSVRLVPQPAETVALALRLELTYGPKDSATDITTSVFDRWRDEIAAGCLWRLKRMAGKPWSDATGAEMYRREFESGMGRLQLKRVRGIGGAPLRVKPHPF